MGFFLVRRSLIRSQSARVLTARQSLDLRTIKIAVFNNAMSLNDGTKGTLTLMTVIEYAGHGTAANLVSGCR